MISWHRDLENARTATEVVRTARDFMASFSPAELATLPQALVPRPVENEDDIRDWSRRLNDEYWRLRSLGGEMAATQEMWSFFLRASIQLARIAAGQRERALGSRPVQRAWSADVA
jgi:hypothetical protein